MRVLVTRPEPGASRTAARLVAHGHEPLTLPLTRIVPLPDPLLPSSTFDAVAITSANAVRHAPESLLSSIRALPCFAVGDETAQIARDSGFADIASANGDAEALAGVIADRLPPGSRLLYLCGRLRRPFFEAALTDAGFICAAVETYETLPIDYGSETLASFLGDAETDIVLVYSAEAAASLMRLLRSRSLPGISSRTLLLCISGRVAAMLSDCKQKSVVATEPTGASMLSLLRDISSAASQAGPLFTD